jgi:putative colanic acid biosynthesis acetyltransferase WcaF
MTEPTTSVSPPAAVNSAPPVVALAPGVLDVKHQASVWSTRDKVRRVAWMVVRAILFRPSFHNWYGWRRFVLRLMGAKVGAGARVRETVRIEIPWNLEIGNDTVVGHEAILYSLGRIRLGRKVTISQYAHLCAGTHDQSDPTFPLLTPPVTVEDGAWVAADAFVGPGVTVGAWAVVGARSTVVKDVPAGQIWAGNPAKFIKPREMKA